MVGRHYSGDAHFLCLSRNLDQLVRFEERDVLPEFHDAPDS